MIEYISGQLTAKSPTSVVIEAAGIGYLLNITLNTYNSLGQVSPDSKEPVRLYIHEVLREDTHDLYGFLDRGERQIFRLLIGVTGIGPATGRLILSTFSAKDLVTIISSGDDAALTTVKGIGKKSAQRVILDLKDKVVTEMSDFIDPGAVSATDVSVSPDRKELYEEAEQAFITLGYTKAMAHKVIAKLIKQDPNMSVNDIIRQGLRML